MLDFETTGLSPAMGDRITEVAALRIVGGAGHRALCVAGQLRRAHPSFITGLTGITQEMVDAAPPVRTVVPELLDFIGGDTLSAHNASFDEKFLEAESRAPGLAPRPRGPGVLAETVAPRVPRHAELQTGHVVAPARHRAFAAPPTGPRPMPKWRPKC